MKCKHYFACLMCLTLPLFLSGCTALDAAAKALSTVLLVVDILLAMVFTMIALNAKNAGERGTNTVTRFVRDTAANAAFGRVQALSMLVTAIFCILGLVAGGRFWVGLPTLLPIVLSFVFKAQSTKNQQRIQDSRVVTKGSLSAANAIGEEAGGLAGAAIGMAAGAAGGSMAAAKAGYVTGKAGGKAIGNVAGKAAAKMTDVDSVEVTKDDVKELASVTDGSAKALVQVADPKNFMEAAKRAGITDGNEEAEDVAARVYAMIPESAKESLKDKSEGEQAMLFLEGKV